MIKLYKYLSIVILLLHAYILSNDLLSINSFDNEFYFLNGFENTLKIYDKAEKLIREEDLSNINKDVVTDFFIQYSDMNSYLFSSMKGTSYLLDENYNLKSSLDLRELFKLNFYGKIYPTNYNSLLIAAEDIDKFFVLENKELNEIMSFSEKANDFYYSRENIFILFNDRVDEYSNNGVYRRSMPFRNIEEPTRIFCSDGNIFIKHKAGIEKLDARDKKKSQKKIEYQSRVIDENDIQDFAVIGDRIALLKENKILFRTIK